MRIAYNPLYKPDGKTKVGALKSAPINDIVFDLPGKSIWAKGLKFLGTDSLKIIIGSSSDTVAGTWTGQHSEIGRYEDGLTIIYIPKVAGASTTTLNINGLGAKTCYYSGNSKLITHYSAGTPILFTYYNDGWRRADYGANTVNYRPIKINDTLLGNDNYILNFKSDSNISYVTTTTSNLTNLTIGINILNLKNNLGVSTIINNASTNDLLPTSKSVYDFVGTYLTSYMHWKGNTPSSGTTFTIPNAASIGDAYRIAVAGTLPAANSITGSAQIVEVGDIIICTDTTGPKYTVAQTNWTTVAGTSALSWNSEVTLATIGGLAIKAKLPVNPTLALKSISFKKADGTSVSYNGSSTVDLTGGINYATLANLVKNNLIIKWGDTEDTNLFTYNGSSAKTIDLSIPFSLLFTNFSNIGSLTTRITIGGVTKDLKIDADKLDGLHETSFYRYRGNYGKSYTAASTEYNLSLGTYRTQESGFSGTLLSFNSNSSASALQFWTHYLQGNLYYRTSVDSNRWGKTNGEWTKILDSDNYASILDSRYYTEIEADNRFVNITGDTMSGPLKLNGSPSQSNPSLQINYTSDFEPSELTIGLLKFGKLTTHDMYLGIAPTTKTHFGRVGYFMHINTNCEFTWASSGWTNLMALTGETGNLWVKGNVTASSFIGNASSATNTQNVRIDQYASTGNYPVIWADVASSNSNNNTISRLYKTWKSLYWTPNKKTITLAGNGTKCAIGSLYDTADRPGLHITGNYPELIMMSLNISNANHGSTIVLGAYNSSSDSETNYRAFAIGMSGTTANEAFLDFGYGANMPNPHSNGVANYGNGSYNNPYIMRLTASKRVFIQGVGNDSLPVLLVSASRNGRWSYAAAFMAPNTGTGNNVYVPIGKAMSTRNCFGFTHEHAGGDGSAANYGAVEVYGVGNLLRWYYDKHTQFFGRVDVANNANDASYMHSALQIREYNYGGSQSDTWAIAPRLSWHWGGRVLAQIGLASNNELYLSKDSFSHAYKLVYEDPSILWNINSHKLDGYHAGNASGNIAINNGTLNTNLNADLLDGVHNGNVTANYYNTNGLLELNLSSLDANTWYPCVMFAHPGNSTPIRVTFTDALSYHKPSWSTHPSGFSFQFDFEWIGGGWGTIPWYLRIYRYGASFGGETACYGLEQRNNRSALVLYMRGGTSYYYRTTDGRSFTVYSTTTNIGDSRYPDNISPRTSKLNDCFLQEASSRFGTCYRASYADIASTVIVNNSDSNANYRIIWHSNNTLYSTAGVYCNPSADTLYATHFYETSDIRLKNIKSEVTISAKELSKLPLFNFTWNNKTNDILYSGTSAQEVLKILPTVVSYTEEYYQLDYATLGTIAGITACKELVAQKSEIELLKERIELLEQQLKMYHGNSK